MQEAIRLAVENAKRSGGPFGAVVVKDARIIGRGQNRVYQNRDPSAHAEILAIREACQALGEHHLQGCELYTSCEPCPMCLAAIYWARLDRAYYAATREAAASAGFDDQRLYAELAKPLNQRSLPMTRILQEQGQAPFQAWADNPNKILY